MKGGAYVHAATRRRTEPRHADPVVAVALDTVLASVDADRVLLFGSRSRGEQRAHSDIDLIVVADVGMRQHALERELRENLSTLALPVDVLLRTQNQLMRAPPTSFLASVVATATTIYSVSAVLVPNKEKAPQTLAGNANS